MRGAVDNIVTLYLTRNPDKWAAIERPTYLTDRSGACDLLILMRRADYPDSHIEVREIGGLLLDPKKSYREWLQEQPPMVQPKISEATTAEG